ncbi:hypothetical protein JVU11DRAFT_5801 [Chiua virens]|nr:hypothetical protein JVU11DRAFT_5801 [Chiua virens]
MSLPISRPELRGRMLGKTASFGAQGVEPVSGKSTPTSLPNHDLNRDTKLPPVGTSNAYYAAARKPSVPKPISHDGDTTMLDIDLTDTDMEWERPISRRTDTIMSIEMDDDASDSGMDMSFIQPELAPQPRVPPPKSKPQPQPPQPRPSAFTQRPRTGPPPLGMRRVPQPQPQPTQYSTSQAPRA